jgi:hypothetical protein
VELSTTASRDSGRNEFTKVPPDQQIALLARSATLSRRAQEGHSAEITPTAHSSRGSQEQTRTTLALPHVLAFGSLVP